MDRMALYLFLIAVSDVQGLSYYSDASVCRRLKIDALQLSAARSQLEKTGLIAFHKPLYQVLSLDPVEAVAASPRAGQTLSVADILQRMAQGGGQ